FHTGRRLRDVPHTAARIPSAPGFKGLLSAWIDASADQPTVYVSTWADPTVANSFGLMVTNWTDAVDTFPPSTVHTRCCPIRKPKSTPPITRPFSPKSRRSIRRLRKSP
ncbi:MAG TPA: hypothetical protein PL086_09375, partial [Candidatus Aminicenantes bacterium]|nr:hypothetical protein [Candidatus Aminicenantes bacterium]